MKQQMKQRFSHLATMNSNFLWMWDGGAFNTVKHGGCSIMLRGCFADSRSGGLKKANGTVKDDHLQILRGNLISVPSTCTESYTFSWTSQILSSGVVIHLSRGQPEARGWQSKAPNWGELGRGTFNQILDA